MQNSIPFFRLENDLGEIETSSNFIASFYLKIKLSTWIFLKSARISLYRLWSGWQRRFQRWSLMHVKSHQIRAKVAFTKPLTTHLMRGKGDFSCRVKWNKNKSILRGYLKISLKQVCLVSLLSACRFVSKTPLYFDMCFWPVLDSFARVVLKLALAKQNLKYSMSVIFLPFTLWRKAPMLGWDCLQVQYVAAYHVEHMAFNSANIIFLCDRNSRFLAHEPQ